MDFVGAGAGNDVDYGSARSEFRAVVDGLNLKLRDVFEVREYLQSAHGLIAVIDTVDHEKVEAAAGAVADDFGTGALCLVAASLRADATHRTRVGSRSEQSQLRKIPAIQRKLLYGFLSDNIAGFPGLCKKRRLTTFHCDSLPEFTDLKAEVLMNLLPHIENDSGSSDGTESRGLNLDRIDAWVSKGKSEIAVSGGRFDGG